MPLPSTPLSLISTAPRVAQPSPTEGWNRTRWGEIARIVTPFWLYVAVANLALMALLTENLEAASYYSRILQHLVLLPILIACYRLALSIGWPGTGRVRAATLHILLALAFSFSTRFVVWATYALVMWDPFWMTPKSMELVPELRAVGIATLIFFMPYWAGLALVVGILAFRRIRDVTLRAAHIESEYVKARLQVLHGQLNPHFLFNTLHSVHGLIDEQPGTARTMLVRLSDLLRRSLAHGGLNEHATLNEHGRRAASPDAGANGLILLSDEMELTRAYLDIQQLRFSDRLQHRIDIDNALARALVPVFVLQPLAENAIKHGMGGAGEQVRVTIVAHQREGMLELEVANTSNRPAQGVREFGVGLSNTSERLRTLYGEQAAITFEHPADDRFVVRVRLPLRFAATAEAA